MNQVELEQEMADGGRAKAMTRFANNEEAHNAHSNPYAQALYRRTVQPMAEALKLYLGKKQAGVAAKNKVLLRDEDPLALAFITVRAIMDHCLADTQTRLGFLAMQVGKSVYGEVLLKHFEDVNPELYFTLVQDFERRLTKSEKHKLAVFKDSAAKDGIALPIWDTATKADVGKMLLGCAQDLGIVYIDTLWESPTKSSHHVMLAQDLRELITQVKGYVAGMMPTTMPCIEPPRPWVSVNDGGYHTPAMRRTTPCAVRGRTLLEDDAVPAMVLDGLNILQSVAWEVNQQVLDVALACHQRFDVGDSLVSDRRMDEPDKPLFLQDNPDLKFEQMSEMQQIEFKEWCSIKREWYTETKIRGSKSGVTNEALYMANRFKGRPLWFVYTADYRGRFYASARGISPQGADLAKALLQFHEGTPIEGQDAEFWFRIAGANRWAADGLDKQPLDVRAQWSKDNADFICRIADDPLSHREWTNADVPFQFLAWAFEFASWHRDPTAHRSRLPLGQDGSCNGLQHFSAMLRDEVGGRSTNLVPDSVQHDIYRDVAEATDAIIQAEPETDTCLVAARWRRHPLSRSLVKRSVMTLPYGSTRFSSADFISAEYLYKGKAPEFERVEYSRAATWLSYRVWDGIGKVVVKGREAMEWLQMCSDVITAAKPTHVSWRSPSGFLVTQFYSRTDVLRIRCRLMGRKQTELKLRTDTDIGDSRRHRNGIAPNFVHSCDAAHMHFFLQRCREEGLTQLALVHDDYGCPAGQVATLHRLLRETFVAMYRDGDPLQAFKDFHESPTLLLPDIPARGDLNIEDVLKSPYFFC